MKPKQKARVSQFLSLACKIPLVGVQAKCYYTKASQRAVLREQVQIFWVMGDANISWEFSSGLTFGEEKTEYELFQLFSPSSLQLKWEAGDKGFMNIEQNSPVFSSLHTSLFSVTILLLITYFTFR